MEADLVGFLFVCYNNVYFYKWHGIAYVYSQLDQEAPFYHQSPFSKEKVNKIMNRTFATHHFMV